MSVKPSYAGLVLGSKVGAGLQGQTDRDRLATTVDRLLVLDHDIAYYCGRFRERCFVRMMHDATGWKNPYEHARAIAPLMAETQRLYGVQDFITENEKIALEGLGDSREDYEWYNWWLLQFLPYLRGELDARGAGDIRLWGPALSPGHREDDNGEFYRILAPALALFDGIAVHNYWYPGGGFIGDPDFEWWAGRIERAHALIEGELGIVKPWAVTEHNRKVDRGSEADIANYAEQCQQLYQWHNSLPYVVASFTFLYCNIDPGFNDLTWERMPGMVEAMQGFDRQSEGDFSPPVPEVPEVAYTEIGNHYRIIDRRGDLPTNGEYARRPLSGIVGIAVHHSGIDEAAGSDHALAAAKYHVNTLGWPGIGYHFVVSPDGRTEQVNDLDRASYHVAWRNAELIGIELPGNFNDHHPTAAQLAACRRLVAEIQYTLGWFAPAKGHTDWARATDPTSCPGLTQREWIHLVNVLAPAGPQYQYVLGFADLAARLGADVVGAPTENERQALVTVQATSKGMMFYEPGKQPRFLVDVT